MKIWVASFLTGCFLICFGCKPSPPDQQPLLKAYLNPESTDASDIILITIDTWRHDAAGFAGNAQAKTPTLDRLAETGLVFEHAYAHATLTLPSHTSLLTGLLPHTHGLHDNAGFRLNDDIPTIAGLLRAQGYTTGAFVSAFPLDSRYGLGHDFDTYDDRIDRYAAPLSKVTERPGQETVQLAQAWLQEHQGRKRFLWVHLYEPHYPYQPPPHLQAEFADKPYLGEVAYADELLAPLLKPYLEGQQAATILLTSDHGEGLGDHGEATHGLFAYEATLKVPMVLWSPKKLRPGRIQQRVGQVDMLPTLLALHDVPTKAAFDGNSLVDGAPTARIYFESLSTYLNRGWAPLRGCIEDDLKAIQLPIPELYDLNADPGELENLAASQRSRYETCLTCLPDTLVSMDQRLNLSAEEREKLASLGYAASPAGTPKLEGLASDPKNLVAVDHEIYEAFGLAAQGAFEQASQRLEALLRDHPEVELAYQYAADYAYQAGQLTRAISILDLAFQRGVASEMSQRKLALYLIEARRLEPAANILSAWSQSQDPETHSARGKLFTNRGQFEQAQAAFQKALALDATNPSVWAELGTMNLFKKDLGAAAAAFRKALDQNDRNAEAWNGLGVVHAQSNRLAEAEQAWLKALEINPNMAFCHRNLANIYQNSGDLEKARFHLQRFADLVQGEPRARALERLRQIQP